MSTDDKGRSNNYDLESGQGFLLWPGQNNTYTADGKEPWEYAWIEFDGLKARELAVQTGLLFNSPVYTAQTVSDRERMKDELMYIVHHANSPPLELMGHFYLFISGLVSSSPCQNAHSSSLRDFYVREAVAFIEQHYQEDMSIEDIAGCCKLNRSYLSKIFKNILKTTPQEFLIRYRIQKACELMKITDRSIREISVMVGYPNALNFSRAFKREMGKSPQQWRGQNKLQRQ